MDIAIKERVLAQVRTVVIGRDREADLLLVAFLSGGHVLLEGVPGISKTILAKSFARCMGLDFKRIQFTPDMLPLDMIGGFVFNTTHNVQARIPVENVLAMYETVREWGMYPLR